MSQLPVPQAFSSEWPSQVISWRFERAWDPNQIAAFTIPDAEDSTTLNARDGVIPGGEPEGPSFELDEKAKEATVPPVPPTSTKNKGLEVSTAARSPLKNPETHVHSTSSPDQVDLRPTVPLNLVRPRQIRKIRDTHIELAYFSSSSGYPIDHPPELLKDSGLEVWDIFVHSYGTNNYQSWRCSGRIPPTWIPIAETETLTVPGDDRLRQFVITDGGKPSFVVPGSIVRRYRERGEAKK